MSAGEPVGKIPPISPIVTHPAVDQQTAPINDFARQLEATTTTTPEPTVEIPAPAVPPAETQTVAGQTVDETVPAVVIQTVPVQPGVPANALYPPYAQTPLRSLPESEPPVPPGQTVELGPPPTTAVIGTGLRQARDQRIDTRVFVRFIRHLNPEQELAESLIADEATLWKSRRWREGGQHNSRPQDESDSTADNPNEGTDDDENAVGERLSVMADVFHFNATALSLIAAVNGVQLPDDFMGDSAYLALTDRSGAMKQTGTAEARHRELAVYLSPARVAERVVDFAICLSDGSRAGGGPPLDRREYVNIMLRLLERAYRETLVHSRDAPHVQPLLRLSRRLIARWLKQFLQQGPDPAKGGPEGVYARLHTWATGGRVVYREPHRHETDIIKKNLSLTGVRSMVDKFV